MKDELAAKVLSYSSYILHPSSFRKVQRLKRNLEPAACLLMLPAALVSNARQTRNANFANDLRPTIAGRPHLDQWPRVRRELALVKCNVSKQVEFVPALLDRPADRE